MASLTKRAIKESFLKLLEQRPLNKITIKDIVEDCGINRNSFYYHFQDIPALIEEIITDEGERLIAENPQSNSMEACFASMVEFVLQNRRAILHVCKAVDSGVYEQYIYKLCHFVVSACVEQVYGDATPNVQDKELIISFYTCAAFGMAMAWLSNGLQEDISLDLKRLFLLKKGGIGEMFRRSRMETESEK